MASATVPVSPPDNTHAALARWTLLATGALAGCSVILWVAANWGQLGRVGQLSLVAASVVASLLASLVLPRLRVPLQLAGLLASGALFALIGQTYQSGADPWQLFAIWAAVTLPLALAARHDAIWSFWSLIVLTAVSLWLLTVNGGRWVQATSLTAQLPAWTVIGVMAAAFSPWSTLHGVIGDSRWAFRVTGVLGAVLIASFGVNAVFASGGSVGLIVSALLALGLAAFALATLRPLALGVLAAVVFAFDVVLVSWIAVAVVSGRFEIGAFLLLGLIAAAVFAVSGAGLLRVVRASGPNTSAATRTWPVAVISTFGALLAAIPLLAFVALSFGSILAKGIGVYLIGGAATAIGVALLFGQRQFNFRQQFGFILLVVGLCLIGFGGFRDLPVATASLLMVLVTLGLAVFLPASWVSAVLGATAATFAASGIGFAVLGSAVFQRPTLLTAAWSAIAVLASAGLFQRSRAVDSSADGSARFETIITGALAVSLIALAVNSGQSFMFAGLFGGFGMNSSAEGALVLAQAMRVMSPVLAVAALALLAHHQPALQSLLGAAVAVVVVAMAAMLPGAGAVLLALAVACVTGRRALLGLALVALLWLAGSFYYNLSWPLLHKAGLAALAAAILGGGVGLTRVLSASRPGRAAAATLPPVTADTSGALSLLSLAMTAAVASTGIWQKETVIRTGTRMFVALAPADPRSLMQGDYMALRFALPSGTPGSVGAQSAWAFGGERRFAIASVDPRGVATLTRLATQATDAKAGELALPMRVKNGQWVVGTDAWFFEEGSAKRWERARFGEFRVSPAGDAVLVDLTDADLKPL